MTSIPGRHPDNLSIYLDGEVSDPEYQAIRLHIEHCSACAEEVENWKSWQELLRAPETEIEVPGSQWRQIMGRLEGRRAPFRVRIRELLRPGRLAWGTAAGLILMAGLVISGLEYRDYAEGRNHLTALSAYSEAEQQWIARADNPFRNQDSMENPFRTPESKNESTIIR